jgi:hypothetical protein
LSDEISWQRQWRDPVPKKRCDVVVISAVRGRFRGIKLYFVPLAYQLPPSTLDVAVQPSDEFLNCGGLVALGHDLQAEKTGRSLS